MKKILFILLMLVGLGFSQTHLKLNTSTALNPDGTLNGKTETITDADSLYTGRASLGNIQYGWAALNIRIDDQGSSTQTFEVSFRYYDDVTGYSDWIVAGTATLNAKTILYLSKLNSWLPAENIQFVVVSTGTGTAKVKMTIDYN